jgi:hypothetical protein
VSWNKQCQNTWWGYNLHGGGYYSGRIVFSKGADNKAYLTTWGTIMRIDDLNGADCPSLTSQSSPYVLGSRAYRNVDTDSMGNLYVSNWCNGLYKSTNYGQSFTLLGPTASSVCGGDVNIDPFNESNILLASSADNKIYQNSVVSPTSFSVVKSNTPYDLNIYFDPANEGYIFSNKGLFSSDSGATWSNHPNHDQFTLAFHIAQSGEAYRVITDDSFRAYVQKTDSLINPTWTTLPASGLDDDLSLLVYSNQIWTSIQIVAQGSNLGILVKNDLWLSQDSGNSFTKMSSPDSMSSLPVIASSDGVTLYGAQVTGGIYKSTDAGESWSKVADAPVFTDTNLIALPHPNNPQSVIFRRSGTYALEFVATSDGFTTLNSWNPASTYNDFSDWTSTIAQNPYDGSSFSIFGSFQAGRITNDYGSTFTYFATANECCDTYYETAIPDISNPGSLWYLVPGSRITYYNGSSGSKENVTNLPFTPSAWDYFAGPDGGITVLMISYGGAIISTSDNFLSYSTIQGPAGANSPALITSLASNRNVMAVADQDSIYYSINGGQNWTKIDLRNSLLSYSSTWDNTRYVSISRVTLTETSIYVSSNSIGKTIKIDY